MEEVMITLKNAGSEFPALVVKPTDSPVKGGLIVIHEVWGLADHIKDVAKRFAHLGYLVIAPDLLSETGITEELFGDLQEELFDPKRRSQAQPKLRELTAPLHAPGFGKSSLEKLRGCFNYLYDQTATNHGVAVVGFCFGGTYSFGLAANEPRLKAAIPFYGHADQSLEELKQITCPVLAFYGEEDDGLVSNLPELNNKMQKAGVNFTTIVYPDCGHAFFNDTNRFSYNLAAAQAAWQRTTEFLAKHI